MRIPTYKITWKDEDKVQFSIIYEPDSMTAVNSVDRLKEVKANLEEPGWAAHTKGWNLVRIEEFEK